MPFCHFLIRVLIIQCTCTSSLKYFLMNFECSVNCETETVDCKLLNDTGMEDAMKSEGEFLIEKELTPIKSSKLVDVDSGEMVEEALEK